MIHESVAGCIGRTPLVYLRRLFPQPGLDVIAKLEFQNPGGSVKDRPARFIIEEGLRTGRIRPGTQLVESSSGNLGIALAMVARVYGLGFTCVVDPKISPTNLHILRTLGAEIAMVTETDEHGGYLNTRIRRVKAICAANPDTFWINQYANELNPQAHYHGTAAEILADLDGPIDYLVVAVSTTGTINGLSRRLRETFPNLQVVAVDAVGSVLFGTPPGKREIPGIGASRVPELFSPEEIDQVVHISDLEATRACHELVAHEGIFAGGSSGSVVAAISKLQANLPRPCRVLTLLPDRGERYLDMMYNDEWVRRLEESAAVQER